MITLVVVIFQALAFCFLYFVLESSLISSLIGVICGLVVTMFLLEKG